MMLADQPLRRELVENLAAAREAASQPRQGINDWYDEGNFR